MIVRTARRRRQSGFAMLLVFLMAAVAALMLYMEIPRVAMDVQRTREQMLIDRGEQYKRAITVFWKENKRYPTKFEELETLNNRHWLRHRYRDPMTGKDEWRIIHIQNGFLTDSLVNKPANQQNNAAQGDNFKWGTGMGMNDPTAGNGQTLVNLANRHRPSDSQNAGLGDGQGAGQPGVTDPNNPNPTSGNPAVAGTQQPGTQQPGMPGMPPGIPQQPGMVNGQPIPLPPGVTIPGMPPQPGVNPQTGQPCTPAQPCPSAGDPNQNQNPAGPGPTMSQPFPNPNPFAGGQPPPLTPGRPVNSQTGGVSPTQGGFQYGGGMAGGGNTPSYPQPGTNIPPPGPNQAQQMIQQMLTTPRPGGYPGAPPGGGPGVNGQGGPPGSGFPTTGNAPAFGGPGNQVVGAGIAGVASNADGEGVHTYNQHTNYKEWEFVFTIDKLKIPPNPLGSPAGTPASQLGNNPTNGNSPFSQQPGVQQPGGQPNQPPNGPTVTPNTNPWGYPIIPPGQGGGRQQ